MTTTENVDEIAMTPAAIEVRARMADEWAASRATESVPPWSVRQHFGEDVPKLIETVIRLKQELDEQLDLNVELLARILAVRGLETSRIGAPVTVTETVDAVSFYAGVSFALAKVQSALRGEATS